MATASELLYAVVGAGDFTFEKVRGLGKIDRKRTQKLYKDFIKRGRTLSTRIGNAGPTKQAVAQTKSARTQVKSAATSVGKAVRANARATRSAAQKTVKAS